MAEEIKTETNNSEPSFKLNYISLILILVILIPAVYTIWANLQPATPAPDISKATQTQTPTAPPPTANGAALEAALKRVADKPDYDSYINLGIVYYQAAKYEDAIKTWNKAIELNPKSAVAYNDIAAAYGAINQYDEEIKACEKALSIDPTMTLAKNNLKWAQSQKNKK
jgi:tetratricopeptide (TPR) repeat protein